MGIFLLSVLLILRTVLSIYLSDLKGSWVRTIVKKDMPGFMFNLLSMTLYSLPSAVVNSGLDYYNRKLGLYFRENLTRYFHKQYLENSMCFYQITNLDTRIANPEQIFAVEIDNFSSSVANLYSNITKPLLDFILFTRKLAKTMGYQGPILMILWYVLCAIVLKYIAPPFGKMIAVQQSK